MADQYWKGGDGINDAERGDFDRAANWQTATGGAGAVPLPADRIIFDGRASVCGTTAGKHTVNKHWNCYDSPEVGPDDCQGVIISANFTGRVGIASDDVQTPIELSLAAGKKLVYKGNEPACFKIKTATKNMPLVVHDSESGLLVISSLNDTNDVWNLIECYNKGTLQVLDDTMVGLLCVYGTTTVIIGEGCPAIDMYVKSGSVVCDSPVGAVQCYGGEITIGQIALVMPAAALDITSLLCTAGKFIWRAYGTMTDCIQYGGTVEMVGSGDKVIGAGAGNIFLLRGGTFDCSGQDGEITFGGGASVMIKGGELVLPNGTKVTAMTTGL